MNLRVTFADHVKIEKYTGGLMNLACDTGIDLLVGINGPLEPEGELIDERTLVFKNCAFAKAILQGIAVIIYTAKNNNEPAYVCLPYDFLEKIVDEETGTVLFHQVCLCGQQAPKGDAT